MRVLLFGLVFALAVLPFSAQADTTGFFGPVIPEVCKCESGITGGGSPAVSAPAYGCVLQTIQNAIKLLISLGFIAATLALMYAGFVWMTAGPNAEKRSQGKNVLLNTLLGIFLILTAWLIIDFVMKTLYSEPTEFGPWNSILAADGARYCLEPTNPQALSGGVLDVVYNALGGPSGSGSSSAGSMTDAQAREALRAGGVEIYNWAATQSLANTRIDTINQAIAIKQACNCRVLVTATTGGTHASGSQSHGTGFKLDLEDTPDLNRFLQSRLTRNGSRGSDARYADSCGNEYVYENAGRNGSHWDILINQGACRL